MGKHVRKGTTIHTRNGYPIAESMSDESHARLIALESGMQYRASRNAAAIRRMHH